MAEIEVTASPKPGGKVFAIFGQQIPESRISEAIEHPDALRVAYSVGVLELVSLSLTILAIILALLSVVGFWMIRGAAVKAADKAAREEIKSLLPAMAQQWFNDEGRKIFEASATVKSGPEAPDIGIRGYAISGAILNSDEKKEG